MATTHRTIPPARAELLRAEGVTALRGARKSLDAAYPYRYTDRRARIVVRCNVRTLRDLRDLGVSA